MSLEDKGPVETALRMKLVEKLDPIYLDVINDSYMHNVPKGSETHFRVTIVSEQFTGKSLLQVSCILYLNKITNLCLIHNRFGEMFAIHFQVFNNVLFGSGEGKLINDFHHEESYSVCKIQYIKLTNFSTK